MGTQIDAVLIDLNGTLHVGDQELPGAKEALSRLRQTGVKIKFVTNTTEMSMAKLHRMLTSIGFELDVDEIFSALSSSIKYIKSHNLRPYLMVDPESLEDFEGIETDNPNAVVIGLAPKHFNYEEMNKAFRLLIAGAKLIAMFITRYYPKTDGQNHIGPGAFVKGLEYSTNCTAVVVGKPAESFFLEAVRELGVRPENTLMIGDDVHDDVEGSMRAGLKGVLVKTGKYRSGDEARIDPVPSLVFDDFPAVVDYVVQQL